MKTSTPALPTPQGHYACCGRTISAETYSQVARQHRALHGATR